MDRSFSRRSFLKGSIAIAAGALGGMALPGCLVSPATAGVAEDTASGTGTGGALKAVKLHRGYAAPHGEKSFAQIVVAVSEDGKILAANVDEYQFSSTGSPGLVPVPNGDSDFAAGFKEGVFLISKVDNSEVYSKSMAEKGGSTQPWADSMMAIEAFAVGKEPSEIMGVSLDDVTGATLVDTPKYLAAIAEVAADDAIVTSGSYLDDGSALAAARLNDACHGTKAFANAVSLVQGSTLVASSIDEFQFVAAGEGVISVPNSDKAFGLDNVVEGQVLTSKSANTAAYSKGMADKAGSTTGWLDSMAAIEESVAGQEIAAISITGPDDVSGATLVDTANYAQLAVDAARLV